MNNKGQENVDAVTSSEVKLLVENALLEQEKRITKEIRVELQDQTNKLTGAIDKQNLMYSEQIIGLNREVTALQIRVSSIKNQVAVVGAVCSALGGLIGFFVAQLIK